MDFPGTNGRLLGEYAFRFLARGHELSKVLGLSGHGDELGAALADQGRGSSIATYRTFLRGWSESS